MSSTCTDVMYFDIVDSLSFFFFPFSPEFNKVVPLLQTCSIYKCAYDHICFCVYIYPFDLSHMRENMWPSSFWTCPPISSINLQMT
jgi:hypothetical protein